MAAENNQILAPTPLQLAGRDIRLDALRGVFLVIMTINHIPTVITTFAYEFVGYTGAAEGFVFLSGLVCGLAYTRIALKRGGTESCRRASLRARTIYLMHLGTFITLFFTFRALTMNGEGGAAWKPLFQQSAVVSVLMGATFLSQPGFLDVLPLFCVLIFAAPHVIAQFNRGNTLLVFGTSLLLWMAAQFHLVSLLLSLLPAGLPVNLGNFDFLAWQAIFVVGLYCGFKRQTQHGWRGRIPPVATISAGAVVLALFLGRHALSPGEWLAVAISKLADKRTLGIARVADFFAVCVLVGSVNWPTRPDFLFKPLAYLGRNSLQVFTFQIFLVYAIKMTWGGGGVQGWLAGNLVAAACVASLFLPAWISEQLAKPQRKVLVEKALG